MRFIYIALCIILTVAIGVFILKPLARWGDETFGWWFLIPWGVVFIGGGFWADHINKKRRAEGREDFL